MLGAGLVKNLDRFPALMETGRQADSRVENTTKNNKRIWGLFVTVREASEKET